VVLFVLAASASGGELLEDVEEDTWDLTNSLSVSVPNPPPYAPYPSGVEVGEGLQWLIRGILNGLID
jgi:hypothetical protein